MRLLKPEPIPANNGYAVEIPSGLNYRVIYMYSDKPEYQMFVKNEPNGESMKIFAGLAPKPFEKGDGIIVLDSNDKSVNHLILRDKSVGGRMALDGELSPMTMEKQSSKIKNQPLNEQFIRMQKLAGIITESQLSELATAEDKIDRTASNLAIKKLNDMGVRIDATKGAELMKKLDDSIYSQMFQIMASYFQDNNALEKVKASMVDDGYPVGNNTNESEINIGQENVIKHYLNKLRKFEQDNTADMADLKNLETAVNMYHKELLNKIK
jgi:hypothetical protein